MRGNRGKGCVCLVGLVSAKPARPPLRHRAALPSPPHDSHPLSLSVSFYIWLNKEGQGIKKRSVITLKEEEVERGREGEVRGTGLKGDERKKCKRERVRESVRLRIGLKYEVKRIKEKSYRRKRLREREKESERRGGVKYSNQEHFSTLLRKTSSYTLAHNISEFPERLNK